MNEPKGINIRSARSTDFEQLLALFDAVVAERQWIGTEPGFDKESYRAAWQGILDGKGGAHFVACHDDEVVGALALYPGADGIHDLGILVSQERRGRRIGSALMREALTWSRMHGVPKLTLGVFPHNVTAIHLYQKSGFVAVRTLDRERVRQTGDMWDVIVMEKDMSRSHGAEP